MISFSTLKTWSILGYSQGWPFRYVPLTSRGFQTHQHLRFQQLLCLLFQEAKLICHDTSNKLDNLFRKGYLRTIWTIISWFKISLSRVKFLILRSYQCSVIKSILLTSSSKAIGWVYIQMSWHYLLKHSGHSWRPPFSPWKSAKKKNKTMSFRLTLLKWQKVIFVYSRSNCCQTYFLSTRSFTRDNKALLLFLRDTHICRIIES